MTPPGTASKRVRGWTATEGPEPRKPPAGPPPDSGDPMNDRPNRSLKETLEALAQRRLERVQPGGPLLAYSAWDVEFLGMCGILPD